MNMIPNYLDPYPDELLYSWLHRLAKANGMSAKNFVRTYLQGERAVHKYIKADVRSVIPALYERISHKDFPNVMDFTLSFSLLPFASLAMQDFVVAQYVNNIFQPYNKLNHTAHGIIQKVCVCPECIKKDTDIYGEPYLHRKHQLPGVCTCEKHGTWLHQYDRRYSGGGRVCYGHECNYDLSDYTEIKQHLSSFDAAAYTKYACSMLDAGVVTNFLNAWRVILKRVADRSNTFKTRFDEFFADYEKWEHAGLYSFNANDMLLARAHGSGGLRMDEVMPIVMFLFPDPKEFTAKLAERDLVLNKYTCPVCGYEYCTATGNAWVCPRCSRDASEEETFALLVNALGDGEYELLTPFMSMREPVRMRHIPCGRVAEYYPIRFLYRNMRCSCEEYSEKSQISCRETLDTKWLKKFELYKRYIKETGHSHVPLTIEYHGTKIGAWVGRQRALNRSGRLTEDRKNMLLEFEPDFFSPEVLRTRDKCVSG